MISNVEFTNILISGDLNCHFQRNSKFTTIIKHWLDEYNLQVLWSLDDDRIEPVDYTFINTSIETTACSTIDHFVVSPRMVNGLLSAGVVHDSSNVSNHSPIYAKFEVGKMDLKTYEYTDRRKVLWGIASDEAKSTFRAVFEDKLSSIHPPNECTNINCTSDDHRNQLEEYTISVLQAMKVAGSECLPCTSSKQSRKKSKTIPGWSDYVQPYAEESKFWHSLWTSAGKPQHGELFFIMKSKKNQYKYAVRKLQRCTNIISKDKLLESLLKNDVSIFNEVRKMRKKTSGLSSQIDNKVDPNEIAEHFSEIYMKLFNTVKVDKNSEAVESKINKELSHSSYKLLCDMDERTISNAVNALKSDKRDSVFNVTSDMYKNSPDAFYYHLTNILKGSLVHGRLPDIVLLCSLMPLVKDNLGDITKSSNYRAIAGGV